MVSSQLWEVYSFTIHYLPAVRCTKSVYAIASTKYLLLNCRIEKGIASKPQEGKRYLRTKPLIMKKKNILIASIASLVVVAATTYLVIRKQKESRGHLPPANAPQLDINNPGDQSNFPAGPSAEPELG